jgi:hypothetical protein
MSNYVLVKTDKITLALKADKFGVFMLLPKK